MKIGPLYQAVLDAAEARRSARREARSMRRQVRQAKFVASIEKPHWVRVGKRVSWV